MKLVYDVKDKPKFGQVIVFAIQQLLAIMAATLVVPIIINGNANLSEADQMSPAAALLGAGVGTIVYLLFTKSRSPVFLGSSFAFVGSMSAAFAGAASISIGYAGLIIGAIFAGFVYVIIAIIVKFVGVGWINKLMPPVVIGPTVAIIGLSLSTNAISDLQKGDITDAAGVSTANPLIAILCGIVTLIVTVICSTYGKKMLKLIPFIIGILAGYALSSVFTVIGLATGNEALQLINFGYFSDLVKDGFNIGTIFSLPDFTFMSAIDGISKIDANYILTVTIAYVPVAFVVFAEHLADHKNISSIIEKDLLTDPGLSRTLLGDGVGSMAGAFFGGCPNTTYGESVGCVAITKNASIVTLWAAAIGAIIIAFFSPFVAFVNSIPACVMGGICIALYGFIAVSGLKMISGIDLGLNKNLFVVSTILVCGIGGLALTFNLKNGTISITSIAMALILGIIVNLILKNSKEDSSDSQD